MHNANLGHPESLSLFSGRQFFLGTRTLPKYELSSRPERSEVEGMQVERASFSLTSHRMHVEASDRPPLSSRARPRDLRFCRPAWKCISPKCLGFEARRADRQPSPAGLGHRFPNIVRARRRGTLHLNLHQYSVENISRTGLQNRRSLGCARDDKGEGGAYHQLLMLVERTAGSLHFASLRRSLGCADGSATPFPKVGSAFTGE